MLIPIYPYGDTRPNPTLLHFILTIRRISRTDFPKKNSQNYNFGLSEVAELNPEIYFVSYGGGVILFNPQRVFMWFNCRPRYRFRKIGKCGLPIVPIGFFGTPPNTLWPGANPAYRRTWVCKCKVHTSPYPPNLCLRYKKYSHLLLRVLLFVEYGHGYSQMRLDFDDSQD